VTRRHHPLLGSRLPVLMEGKIDLTLRTSDGSSMRIARTWTDADGEQPPGALGGNEVFTIPALRELIALVTALHRRP